MHGAAGWAVGEAQQREKDLAEKRGGASKRGSWEDKLLKVVQPLGCNPVQNYWNTCQKSHFSLHPPRFSFHSMNQASHLPLLPSPNRERWTTQTWNLNIIITEEGGERNKSFCAIKFVQLCQMPQLILHEIVASGALSSRAFLRQRSGTQDSLTLVFAPFSLSF